MTLFDWVEMIAMLVIPLGIGFILGYLWSQYHP